MGGEQYIVRFQVCGQAQAWLRGEDVPAMHSPRGLYQLVLSANLPANDFETMPIVQPGGLWAAPRPVMSDCPGQRRWRRKARS